MKLNQLYLKLTGYFVLYYF